jgi:hypothetical protein
MASSPPSASSHMRVVVTKYARAGSASDRYTDHTSDGTNTTANAIPHHHSRPRAVQPNRRGSHVTTSSSKGHTR